MTGCSRVLAVVLLAAVAGCASGSGHAARSSAHEPRTASRSSTAKPFHPAAGCPTTPRKGALTAFDANGSLRWNRSFPAGDDPGDPPVVTDGDLVLGGFAGTVSAVGVRDGAVRWQRHLGARVFALWVSGVELVANVDQVSRSAKIVGMDARTGAVRWTYDVPGRGFLGDAVLTDDGGLAVLVAAPRTLTVLDLATGRPRWSVPEPGAHDDGLPAASDGLVLAVVGGSEMFARDDRTGQLAWQVPVDAVARVVVSGAVAVAVPLEVSGPTTTVVAHSMADGREVWRKNLADISNVFADSSGFVLADYRANTLSLVSPTGAARWVARLHKLGDLDHAPASTDGALVETEHGGVAFVDRSTGAVHHVRVPDAAAITAAGKDAFVTGNVAMSRVTSSAVSWTKQLPHFTQAPALALPDGGAAVESQDLECVVAD